MYIHSTQTHPNGGRSFEIEATNGISAYTPVGNFAGLTLTAKSGTGRVWQTSASLASVQAGTAVWEIWSYGTTTAGGTLHGAVQGASAVYVEAIGGTSVLGIRD